MSSDEIWYFLRGQETVGPFSKEIIRQIHEGGQLHRDSLVWREGLDGWKSAGEVSELELNESVPVKGFEIPVAAQSSDASPESKRVTPVAEGPVSPPPGGGRSKLRLKGSSSATAAADNSAPLIPMPIVPGVESEPPVKKQQEGSPSSIIREAASESEVEEKSVKGPSWIQQAVRKVFSSLIMTPLFLAVSGTAIFFFQDRFPDVFWFVGLAAGMGFLGFLSLLGFRVLNGLLRLGSILFLLPALMYLWPVIMSERAVAEVSTVGWSFVGFCCLYALTVFYGLSPYEGSIQSKVAVGAGVVVLGAIGWVCQSPLLPQEWKEFVQQGSKVRLPGSLARLIQKPEWGASVGEMEFAAGSTSVRWGIEKAVLHRLRGKEYRFMIQTLEERFYVAKITLEDEGVDLLKNPEKLIGSEWPLQFSKDSFSKEVFEETDSPAQSTLSMSGKEYRVVGGTIKFTKAEENRLAGVLELQFTSHQQGNVPSPLTGKFETEMKFLVP